MLGILLGFLFSVSIEGYVLIGIFAILLLCIFFYNRYALLFISLVFLLAGNFIFHSYMKGGTLITAHSSSNLQLKAEIKSEAIDRGRYLEYDVYIHKLLSYSEVIPVSEMCKLQVKNSRDLYKHLSPGDIVVLNHTALVEDLRGNHLDGYQFYLKGKGFKGILEVEGRNISAFNERNGFSLLKISYTTRKYIEGVLDQSLSPLHSGMLKSIMFGNQGYLDSEMLKLFSISGTAHIIAVSGLHVGVIALLLHQLLKFFNLSKKKILMITMLVLFFYSAIVNFPISIVRASSMYYLYVLSYFIERRYDAINSLMMIALILLLYNPLNLFSVSFQLSFSATLSILLLYPIIKEKLIFIPKQLQSLLAVTISAQVGTIPILIYHFQQMSLVAFIANILIVPTLVPLLFMAFASIFFSLFAIELAVTINYLTNLLLTYIYWIVNNLSQWSLASIEVAEIKFFHILVYYLTGFVVYLILWQQHQKKLMKEKEGISYEL